MIALAVTVPALACGSGTEPSSQATQLVPSTGGGQSWYFNNPLPDPYSVTALDARDRPVSGLVVTWTVASGGGSVDPSQSTTDASGMAGSVHMLGPSAPAQSVTAASTMPSLPAVTFTANAAAPPGSAAVSVKDDVFDQANVVVQLGGTVTWTWAGVNPHSVTFGTGTPSSATQTSGTYAQTFSSVGTFSYFCKVHGGMNGTVTVVK